MKHKVRLTVLESRCRCGLHEAGEEHVVDDVCPPICHELWNVVYPMTYVLGNGGELDSGDGRAASFTSRCPDRGRVVIKGERL
ncbi:MAG: TIGR04076 family protein [Clostridia bacterium]|nr:TIGR04076 family protein [Clostridia bacterium]